MKMDQSLIGSDVVNATGQRDATGERQRLPCQVVMLDPQGSDKCSLSDNTHLAERGIPD